MSKLESVETLVIGSGPGGYVAALRSSQLGMKTAIVERSQLGGVCTNVGCIPSKALIAEAHRYEILRQVNQADAAMSFVNAQAFKQGIVNKQAGGVGFLMKTAGVSILEGEASLVDGHTAIINQNGAEQTISFKYAILATGSRPIELKAFPFGGRILSSTEALSLPAVPSSLIVIGGGYIGVELGQMYAKFGTKVMILEGGERVLPGFETDLVAPVVKQLKTDGASIVTGAIAEKVVHNTDTITLHYSKDQEQHHVTAEFVLVTVGRKPNTDGRLGLEHIGLPLTSRGLIETDEQCRTAIPHIFAIGDITEGPALAHKASYEAKIAAEAIAGQAAKVDYKAMPLVVFSEPELASVGLSETEAKEKALPIVIGRASFAINGRALALRAAEGYIKIVAKQGSGIVLGAQIVGVEASTLISELALAIEMGATVEDLALTIHPHPTLGEVIMEAAENAVRKMDRPK
ncbi:MULTISPECIES: dihydrolipoyl dehydrogenase [Paenibacillus]|jgi:dihydrolipoamide dehydrogenase|uniref:Dihydrolipoyl dehydrogenase n=1 Tax=Paenibacillus polymyxa TaxID=1406 RepID=A0AAP4E8W1_PAEPO|nr:MULTISPECIES: dihydrolipoyl dehydrogenase [Paenibacillus]ALA41564.1 dihydrolipoamide dehydrogenase [Paenibacillus peoriae]APB76719.1 dihydrolipoyl dehydrogenase [Paenibacillus polymyxa]APQ58781.1 dihydrolipoamide dehydrogenase [Paenibacillus polymyxa]MCP3744756.1 dihydrolipoyl dehydrogenase [Paenibacillus sp. A3M_27_13]MDH2329823.1 dihydrolipoyl dehydrogenase [Paenibacillus polymyxa]